MGDNEMKYKQLSIIILLCCIIASCTTRNDIVKLIYNEWISHDEQAFVFDFSKSMDFDWDVMCIYSAKCSLEFIERDLGVPYSDFVDTGERVIFLKNKRIVYSQAWYSVDYSNKEGIVFTNLIEKLKYYPNNAKFRVTKKDNAFFLSPI